MHSQFTVGGVSTHFLLPDMGPAFKSRLFSTCGSALVQSRIALQMAEKGGFANEMADLAFPKLFFSQPYPVYANQYIYAICSSNPYVYEPANSVEDPNACTLCSLQTVLEQKMPAFLMSVYAKQV